MPAQRFGLKVCQLQQLLALQPKFMQRQRRLVHSLLPLQPALGHLSVVRRTHQLLGPVNFLCLDQPD
jgi:hypothetical protein